MSLFPLYLCPACFTSCSKSTSRRPARNSCELLLWVTVFNPEKNWLQKWQPPSWTVSGAQGCLHEGCGERTRRALFVLSGLLQDTFTHSALSQHDLFRTNGFCGALGEATARGEYLYVDMASDCGQGGNRNMHRPKRTKVPHHIVSPTFRPGVFQITLFKGFSNIPPQHLKCAGVSVSQAKKVFRSNRVFQCKKGKASQMAAGGKGEAPVE